MTVNQYEFAQYDFGRETTIKLYEEDKETQFNPFGYTGVIQSFKRHGDGSFFPFRDVARGLAVMGIGAQIIADVSLSLEIGDVTSITVTNGGSGYTTGALVTIDSPESGETATASAQVVAGIVIGITIISGGNGYKTVPTITLTPAGSETITDVATATSEISDLGSGEFTWTDILRPTVPGYMWLKAVLTKTSNGSVVSSKLLRVFVELGAPS